MNTNNHKRMFKHCNETPRPHIDLETPYDDLLDIDDAYFEQDSDILFDLDDIPNETHIKPDSIEDVINNNVLLTDYYLKGSEIFQSADVTKNNDIYKQLLYPGSDFTVLELIIVLELVKTTLIQ